ncbi:MAG: cyclopropane-fatty-acyl-phospholipid synthase family protein [Thermaceae bacterium]|nr:cyclopropane-fatty-acyl-phospholipid synthase family protein [Thermaceae bacterium]
MSTASISSDRVREAALGLLERVLPKERGFAVDLWGEAQLPASISPTRATLSIRSPQVLGQMLQPPLDLSLGEAFLRGDLEIEGDLEVVFAAVEGVAPKLSALQLPALLKDLATLRRQTGSPLVAQVRGAVHSKARDRQAIAHHYDVSNAFYKLWLDSRMVYSCAYFPSGAETLDQAQQAKLEHICRKLRLKPGQRLLDIGSGWGGLILYAAQHYGVEVLGITLSQRQAEETQARLRAAGLEGRVRVELLDYREVRETFDKVVSVGMAEHVGRTNLPTYFKAAWNALRPGGLMLHHVITQGPVVLAANKSLASGEFMKRYVFPDGEILPLWTHLEAAEQTGFEVRDVEDLREHYTLTLRHWVQNLEARWEEAVREVGAERARLWRLYMAASAHQFAYGHLAVHQVLLARPDKRGQVGLPPTRAELYRAA